MKFLSMAGTAAMFLVGGGILTHNVRALHFAIEAIDGVLGTILGMLADLLVGVLVGTVVFGVVNLMGKLRPKPAEDKHPCSF